MIKSSLTKFILLLFTYSAFGQDGVNVIYGDNHIFTISTPAEWVNDQESAKKIGLASIFFPKDKMSSPTYFYAMGYDKDQNQSPDLAQFIEKDLIKFREKYPDFTYSDIKTGASGGVIASKMSSFSNLSDRYREEVVYLETAKSIIVIAFSAKSESDYNQYQTTFDSFLSSFTYRGDNPKPFLEWQSKN